MEIIKHMDECGATGSIQLNSASKFLFIYFGLTRDPMDCLLKSMRSLLTSVDTGSSHGWVFISTCLINMKHVNYFYWGLINDQQFYVFLPKIECDRCNSS